MGTRGRPSSADLSVVSFETIPRPKAPAELTDEEAHEWTAIVSRLAAEHFPRETWPLLVQLCRHTVTARRLSQLKAAIEAEKDFDLKAYDQCLKMMNRESMAICSLSAKLRISQSATAAIERSHKPRAVVKPWE